ncbi:MAG: polyamine aminopropyltransferase [Azoarcus sp.]|nr:MAG: polyamine aminopropyltransferase [Azoarcus sp.]
MSGAKLPEAEGLIFEQLNDNSGYFYRGGELIEQGHSEFQAYEVWDSPQFGRLFRLDGCFMTSERDEFYYHENIIHVPAITHPSPRSALIIGGGDGGSADELFKHPTMERVVLAELDEKVIDIARHHLQSVHNGALDDPRLEIRIGDGLRYVMEDGPAAGDTYDLIVLDLTDPVGPAEALYAEDFLRACAAMLTPGGALSLHIGAPVFQPERVRDLVARLRHVFGVVRPYFLYMPLYGSLWGLATASATLDPLALDADEVDRRIAERGIGQLQYYNGEVHRAQFAQPNHLRKLLGG